MGDAPDAFAATASAQLTDDQLVARVAIGLAKLDRTQLALIDRYMAAMQRPVEVKVGSKSDLADPLFVAAVGHYLTLHHATQTVALNKKAFEFLFQYACDAAGKRALINRNTTDANADVSVDGVGFSLKTQSDKAVRRHNVYIQKFMEGRFIRDINSPEEFRTIGIGHILDHVARYQRILVLKAYQRQGTSITYELVEIPRSVFDLLRQLKAEDFPEKNKYGTCSVSVRDTQGQAFRLCFDGSVEKIRIFNLKARKYISHAEWSVQVPDEADEDQEDENMVEG
jgi:hypothetical protein